MKAVITGASSGIGYHIAMLLSDRGYDTVLVGRSIDALNSLTASIKGRSVIEAVDLSLPDNAKALFLAHPDADVIVNCAGVGVYGEFADTDLDRELDMISLNVSSLHILTKLYYSEFVKRGSGMILNVSSSAAYFVGPMYSAYYATKAYVQRLTRAIAFESRKMGYGVGVTLFCPGPVKTNFGKRDNISDGLGAVTAELAAKKAVEGMMAGRSVVYSDFKTRLLIYVSKIIPECILTGIVYKQQLKKRAR